MHFYIFILASTKVTKYYSFSNLNKAFIMYVYVYLANTHPHLTPQIENNLKVSKTFFKNFLKIFALKYVIIKFV